MCSHLLLLSAAHTFLVLADLQLVRLMQGVPAVYGTPGLSEVAPFGLA